MRMLSCQARDRDGSKQIISDVLILPSVLISSGYFWFFIIVLKPTEVQFLKMDLKVYGYLSGIFSFTSCPTDTTGSIWISFQRECLSHLRLLSPEQV